MTPAERAELRELTGYTDEELDEMTDEDLDDELYSARMGD